jgi:hypothetical protein
MGTECVVELNTGAQAVIMEGENPLPNKNVDAEGVLQGGEGVGGVMEVSPNDNFDPSNYGHDKVTEVKNVEGVESGVTVDGAIVDINVDNLVAVEQTNNVVVEGDGEGEEEEEQSEHEDYSHNSDDDKVIEYGDDDDMDDMNAQINDGGEVPKVEEAAVEVGKEGDFGREEVGEYEEQHGGIEMGGEVEAGVEMGAGAGGAGAEFSANVDLQVNL